MAKASLAGRILPGTLALDWLTEGNGDRHGECDGDGVLAGIGDEGAEQWSKVDGDSSGEDDPSALPGYRKAEEKRRWRTLLPPVFASLGDRPAGSVRDGMSNFWLPRRDRGGVRENAPGGSVNSISFDLFGA